MEITIAGLEAVPQFMPQIARLPGAAALENCDVLVIGGGPAGSTISALLARQRREVGAVPGVNVATEAR